VPVPRLDGLRQLEASRSIHFAPSRAVGMKKGDSPIFPREGSLNVTVERPTRIRGGAPRVPPTVSKRAT
jgi:hypothetical protein